jgi:hypothetical protein
LAIEYGRLFVCDSQVGLVCLGVSKKSAVNFFETQETNGG